MAQKTMRFATYNIRKARGLDQLRRPERTLEVINRLEADIVLLQEADRRLGDRPPAIPRELIEAETDLALVEVSANDHSLGWHGNAVLVRDLSAVGAVRRVDLPGLEPRGAVVVDIAIGSGLSVVATHLGLRRRDRRAQLAVLDEVTQGRERTVVGGDFNEWSAARGMEPLEARFEIHAPGRSFHARRPIASLDRFALSGGAKLRDAGVDESPLARRASDHLPVWTDIEFVEAPSSVQATC